MRVVLDIYLRPTSKLCYKSLGRAPEQVTDFLEEVIDPVLLKYAHELSSLKVDELNV